VDPKEEDDDAKAGDSNNSKKTKTLADPLLQSSSYSVDNQGMDVTCVSTAVVVVFRAVQVVRCSFLSLFFVPASAARGIGGVRFAQFGCISA